MCDSSSFAYYSSLQANFITISVTTTSNVAIVILMIFTVMLIALLSPHVMAH